MHRKSAMKHARADQAKRERNRHRKATLRTLLKQTEAALAEGNIEASRALYKSAASQLDRAAGKGVIKKGTANRQKSRLNRKLNALAVQATQS